MLVCSKTKSYQIQRGFLLLVIFLPSRPWPSGRMPSDLILDETHSPKLSRIPDPFQQSEPCPVRWVPCWLDAKGPHGGIGVVNFSPAIASLQSGWSNTRKPYSLRPTNCASHHPHGGSKGLGLRVNRGHFLATPQATNLGWSLICRITTSSARNRKAIRGDLDPNGIESRKVASQQMGCWWEEIETAVGWRLVRFSTIGWRLFRILNNRM